MWYLNRGGRLDMNVQDAWTQGVTGKGVSVTILDDGIEKSHPDLVANYDPLGEYHSYPLDKPIPFCTTISQIYVCSINHEIIMILQPLTMLTKMTMTLLQDMT